MALQTCNCVHDTLTCMDLGKLRKFAALRAVPDQLLYSLLAGPFYSSFLRPCWTGLDCGLDWTIVWVVFIALGYRDPNSDIEWHPHGWRDMAMHPQLPDPFGNKTGGLVWDWAWPGNLVPSVSRILVTGMNMPAQETWAFTKCPRHWMTLAFSKCPGHLVNVQVV